ncbi:MAG: hypothetical protein HZR80_06430 [Candidatus Heimdallarchaeota archaeon]
MNNGLDNSREQASTLAEKVTKEPVSEKTNKQQDFSSSMPNRFCSHLPRTVSHVIHHLPILAGGFIQSKLLKCFFKSKESFAITIDDSKEYKKLFPVKFSPSLDLALAATLSMARYSGKVSVLVVPNTSLARKVNHFLQTNFNSHCRVATTISSLAQEVSCELFGDARIILSTYNSFLRKLLTKDHPSFHSVVFYQPLNHQNHSLLTTYLFDILLLRLEFSFRGKNSLRKIFLCDPLYLSVKGYQLLTKCSNNFSIVTSHPLDESFYLPPSDSIYKHAFLLMLGLLFGRHLTRKQLFTEMHSSYLYRSLLAVQAAGSNDQTVALVEEELEELFDKQLYKAFILLSHPSLGPFIFIKKSKNRYTLTAFGEEFLSAITYSDSALADIINLIEFLCTATKAKTFSWDSFLEYLLKSFPVNAVYSYNQSFNQLLAFIQQVREIYNSLSEPNFDTLSPKAQIKLSKLLHSRKYSFGDFQNMKILSSIGQRLANDSLAMSLQAIDEQMLKSFYSKKTPRKKNILYNKQKMQELVLTEVLSSEKPQTVSQVALSLNLNKHLTDRVLRSFVQEQDSLIVSKTVTTAIGRRTFFGSLQNFPHYFEFTCSNCQFYTIRGICSVFETLGRLAPHKLPTKYRTRAEKPLKPSTVACNRFSPKTLRQESFTLEKFGDLTREVQGLTDLGASFHHNCIYCSSVVEAFGTKYIPQVGTSTISCSYCGSLFKLSRSKKGSTSERILVKCHEGNLNTFVNVLYDISGMVWDDHKRELAPLHGMTIRLGEKVSLEGDYLIIENIRKNVNELEYLYSSAPLSRKIVTSLEKKGVRIKFNPIVYQLQEQAETGYCDQMTADHFNAILALRVTCTLNNSFLYANIYSRWAVTNQLLCLQEKGLNEHMLSSHQLFDFEWEFLDILLLSRNVHHAFTSRICEGLAGNIMWLFLKEVFKQKNLNLFSRVRDRYVPEKEFFPDKRTLAFSAISALTNFFLILIQDHLKALHMREGLPWKGSSGLIHGTRKTSFLDELGFFLDFIDPIKIAALYFIARAITDESISSSDVEDFISPSGATLFAVKLTSISKLEILVDAFFSEKVVYASSVVSLEEAYTIYLREFFKLVGQTNSMLKSMTLNISGTEKSASAWLILWDKLSFEEQAIVSSKLREKLSYISSSLKFVPFSYLPPFLQEKCDWFQTFICSLEDFDLYDAWEECILRKNNIRSFLFLDEYLGR